jgi:hypothetical protein
MPRYANSSQSGSESPISQLGSQSPIERPHTHSCSQLMTVCAALLGLLNPSGLARLRYHLSNAVRHYLAAVVTTRTRQCSFPEHHTRRNSSNFFRKVYWETANKVRESLIDLPRVSCGEDQLRIKLSRKCVG